MQAISERVPLTHGIEAARELADGASLGDVSGLLATEAAIGVVYTCVGLPAAALHGARRAASEPARRSHEARAPPLLGRLALQREEPDAVGLLHAERGILPVFYATIAFFMFQRRRAAGVALLYVSLGAGMMGIWSSTLFGSGGADPVAALAGDARVRDRRRRRRFLLVLLPMTLATASIGLYSLASTLLWGRLLFGVPLDLAHPVWFPIALPATVLSLGLLGPRAGLDLRPAAGTRTRSRTCSSTRSGS